MPRSPMLHGLSLTIRNPRPLLWTYVFNASLAWLASTALRTQFSEITRSSLAAQRVIGGFDLGVVLEAAYRMNEGPHGSVKVSALSIPLSVLATLLFVPGTLLVYRTNARIGLGGLLQRGIESFWSFVRIIVVTLLIAIPVLGLASVVQAAWANFLDKHILGRPGFLLYLAGAFAVFLVGCLLRLYFDLVEVHTVALAETLKPNGRPDRRIRRTFKPAFQSMRAHFLSTYAGFVLLALLGGAAVYLLGFSALRHLGQERAWPTLVLAQLGLFLMLFTRFWQRAAETVLVQDLFPPQVPSRVFVAAPRVVQTQQVSAPSPEPDPLPPPEPIAPSLETPDPGVFHHDVEAAPHPELPPKDLSE